jgi:hypothetical protein
VHTFVNIHVQVLFLHAYAERCQHSTANEDELRKLEEQLQAASESAGDTEVRFARNTIASNVPIHHVLRQVQDAKMGKAKMFSRIGAKDKAYAAYDDILTKDKISTGKKIDAIMDKARVALFWLVRNYYLFIRACVHHKYTNSHAKKVPPISHYHFRIPRT